MESIKTIGSLIIFCAVLLVGGFIMAPVYETIAFIMLLIIVIMPIFIFIQWFKDENEKEKEERKQASSLKIDNEIVANTALLSDVFPETELDVPPEGKHISHYGNGQIRSEVNFKDGKYEGNLDEWWRNGKKRKEECIMNGKAEGVWINWYENGHKELEGCYFMGRQIGQWNYWHENGQRRLEVNFKERQVVSRKEWDENGKEIKC